DLAFYRHAEREGDGLLCMSLPQSALPCSSHLSPMPRLYHLHILHLTLHFPNTHISTRSLSSTTHPHKHKNTIFFCTIHTSSTRSLSSWTQTLSKLLHITIGSDHFPVSGNTLCGNVLPMCM